MSSETLQIKIFKRDKPNIQEWPQNPLKRFQPRNIKFIEKKIVEIVKREFR